MVRDVFRFLERSDLPTLPLIDRDRWNGLKRMMYIYEKCKIHFQTAFKGQSLSHHSHSNWSPLLRFQELGSWIRNSIIVDHKIILLWLWISSQSLDIPSWKLFKCLHDKTLENRPLNNFPETYCTTSVLNPFPTLVDITGGDWTRQTVHLTLWKSLCATCNEETNGI